MKQSFKPHLFLYSIFSPVDGFFIVLGHPKMWIASILPIILNFLLFVISIVLVVLIGQTVNDWSVIEDIDSKIHVLSWILNVIWIFLGLLFAYFIFLYKIILNVLISANWNNSFIFVRSSNNILKTRLIF